MSSNQQSKRRAERELNHDNWDQEEEPEEAGVFKVASPEDLSGRVIRTARRRAGQSAGSRGGSGIFANFAGFKPGGGNSTSTPLSTTPSGPPKFPAPAARNPLPDTKPPLAAPPSSTSTSTSASASTAAPAAPAKRQKLGEEATAAEGDFERFCRSVRTLNKNLIAHVTAEFAKHENVDMGPAFLDYFRHMNKLKKKYGYKEESQSRGEGGANGVGGAEKQPKEEEEKETRKETPTFPFPFGQKAAAFKIPTTTTVPAFGSPATGGETAKKIGGDARLSFASAFGAQKDKSGSESGSGAVPPAPTVTPTFRFNPPPPPATGEASAAAISIKEYMATAAAAAAGKKDTLFPPASPPKPFSFGLDAAAASSTSQPKLPFGGGAGDAPKPSGAPAPGFFGFGAVAAPPAAQVEGDGEEEKAYVPPRTETVEHEEPEAFYSRRCKLYFLSEGKYAEKGSGTLYLKNLESGKVNLLVRAGTATGTILLNISLSGSMKFETKPKGNVSFVCVPHPPLDPKNPDAAPDKPVPFLIRVKTPEDATELCEKLTEAAAKD